MCVFVMLTASLTDITFSMFVTTLNCDKETLKTINRVRVLLCVCVFELTFEAT